MKEPASTPTPSPSPSVSPSPSPSPSPAPTGLATIIRTSPKNGEEHPGTVIDIEFDREIAEVTPHSNRPVVAVESDAPFEIYRKEDGERVYTTNKFSGGRFGFTDMAHTTLRVSPTNASVFLKPETTYYITMGEGFVTFTDGSVSPAIKKGEWEFTVPRKITEFKTTAQVNMGTNTDLRPAVAVDLRWEDKWFTPSATQYNHDLARAALILSGAAYGHGGSRPGAQYIREALEELGFEKDNIKSENYGSDYYDRISAGPDASHHVGYTIAMKRLDTGKGEDYLVAVVIKGTSANNEWYSNFEIGSGKDHKGFSLAAEEVEESLEAFLKAHNLEKAHTKLLVTGHSRGAAVANLVAAHMTNSAYAAQSNVFGYTFATPTVSTQANEKDYGNIFNILNPEDFVSRVPLSDWGFRHYGIDLLLPTDPLWGTAYPAMARKMKDQYSALTSTQYVGYKNIDTTDNALEAMKALAPTLYDYNNTGRFLRYDLFNSKTKPKDYFRKLAGLLAEDIGRLEFASFILPTLTPFVGDYYKLSYFFICNGDDISQGLTDDLVVTLARKNILGAHAVATYYSWLHTDILPEDLYALKEGSKSTSISIKRVDIACPVDVYVYDESGALAASVVNEAVVKDGLGIQVEDGKKTVYLPSGQEYSLRIEAREAGTVQYTVEELTVQSTGETVTRTVAFDAIHMAAKEELTGNVNDTPMTPAKDYALTKKDTGGKTTVILASSDTAAAPEGIYADVKAGDWYYSAVKFVTEEGLMNGVGEDRFAPGDNLSRAMLAQVLFNKEGKPTVIGGHNFKDVQDGQWYTAAIIWASNEGIVKGYPGGLFGTGDNITREQLATMLWRYLGEPKAAGASLSSFQDAGKVSGYASDAMKWAVKNGVINGKGDGILDPGGFATRAEVAQMLKNYWGKAL